MSLKVIELNDSAVSVSDESGLIVQSPGFALVGEKGLEIGEAAERQARITPTSSFNKFWHQLSMEPLSYSPGNVRHYADLAYAHLLHLSEKAELDGDVILAVPGNFTSQQLAILLGLTKQCPFNPVGIVDAALARVISLARKPSLVYADIQLHQALLTKFSIKDGQLQRESVIQIPEVGMQNFMDLTMQLATDLFIQQCRFNPQHNAESEQQLYNELPVWLSHNKDAKSSLLMEIKTANTVHQAKLPWESLVQKLEDYYVKINQQIATLVSGKNSQLLVSSNLADLPDYIKSLESYSEVQIVTPESTGKACIELQEYINSVGEGFRFVTSLPVLGVGFSTDAKPVDKVREEVKTTANEDSPTPTHVLFQSHALPLGKVAINNDTSETLAKVNGSGIKMTLNDMPEHLGQIEMENNEVYILCGEAGAIVNGEKITGKKQLSLGDRIKFNNDGADVSLIRVRDGII